MINFVSHVVFVNSFGASSVSKVTSTSACMQSLVFIQLTESSINQRRYLLCDVLHWLSDSEFKVCLLVYKLLQEAEPGYLRYRDTFFFFWVATSIDG